MIMYNWLVYLLQCSDATYYCGITNDIMKRLNCHNSGKGAKYTRGRLPVTLLISTNANLSKAEALGLEYTVKQLPRNKKVNFIKNFV